MRQYSTSLFFKTIPLSGLFITPFLFLLFFIIWARPVQAGYYDYNDVLLVVNDNSATSTVIANYFKSARNIPDSNVVHLNVIETETISRSVFEADIRTPIENFLTSNNLTDSINYIVTTKGVPLRIARVVATTSYTGDEASVDSELTLILNPSSNLIGLPNSSPSQYYEKNNTFSRSQYGIYLVTRLTGYTIDGVKALIDRSSATAIGDNPTGAFVLDVDPNRDVAGYVEGNNDLRNAASLLTAKGYTVTLDQTNAFLTNKSNLLGYASWGSNDANYTNHAIPGNTYVNGAIGTTFVSTNGRTFTSPASYGQSLTADLLAEGVSGGDGAVYEPYLSGNTHPDVLFDRYTDGYNLADSFGMANQQLSWMMVIVGDPKMTIKKNISFNLTSPANSGVVASTQPTFTWEAVKTSYHGFSKYQLYIDGVLAQDNISGTSTVSPNNLSVGGHTWYVQALDAVGNAFRSREQFTFTVTGYAPGYTFYVDNVAGNDTNVGSQSAPLATINKAVFLAQAGDTIVIVKNNGVPYRESITPKTSGASNNYITLRGVSSSEKPEIWGSVDASGGWTTYDATTYRKTVNYYPFNLVVGSSLPTLVKRTRSAVGTAPSHGVQLGEWLYAGEGGGINIYYHPLAGENINNLHIELSPSNKPNIIDGAAVEYWQYQDLILKYPSGTGLAIGPHSKANRLEIFDGINAGIQMTDQTSDIEIAHSIVSGFSNNSASGNGMILSMNGGNIHHNVVYGNGNGFYLFGRLANATIKNNISVGNVNNFNVSEHLTLIVSGFQGITASYNSWQGAVNSRWTSYYKGSNNLENIDPLLVAPISRDFSLSDSSPNIDAGTNLTGVTTDALGNPIYGPQDIGAIEYQPPYSIASQRPIINSAIRLYANGKYRYLKPTISTYTAYLAVSPSAGWNSSNYSSYLDITINDWRTSGSYRKEWTETADMSGSVVHRVGDLKVNTSYNILVDNNAYATATTNSSGVLTFTYSGGYSKHAFEIAEPTTPVTPTPTTTSTPTPTVTPVTPTVTPTPTPTPTVTPTPTPLEQYLPSEFEKTVVAVERPLVKAVDNKLVARVKGRILLQVEERGEAWYVDTKSEQKFYLRDGSTAYQALRKFGLGITNANLANIPIGFEDRFEDVDTDADGLSDKIEEALKTNINNPDSDGDGFKDGEEVKNGFNPLGAGAQSKDTSLANRLKGSILLQVESRGEAWYIHPDNGKRYYLKNGAAAYQIMRFLSLGITNADLRKIEVGAF